MTVTGGGVEHPDWVGYQLFQIRSCYAAIFTDHRIRMRLQYPFFMAWVMQELNLLLIPDYSHIARSVALFTHLAHYLHRRCAT